MAGEGDKLYFEDTKNTQVDGTRQYASGGAPGMAMAPKSGHELEIVESGDLTPDQEDLLMIQLSSFEGRADPAR